MKPTKPNRGQKKLIKSEKENKQKTKEKNKNTTNLILKLFLLKLEVKEYPEDIIVVKIADKIIKKYKKENILIDELEIYKIGSSKLYTKS